MSLCLIEPPFFQSPANTTPRMLSFWASLIKMYMQWHHSTSFHLWIVSSEEQVQLSIARRSPNGDVMSLNSLQYVTLRVLRKKSLNRPHISAPFCITWIIHFPSLCSFWDTFNLAKLNRNENLRYFLIDTTFKPHGKSTLLSLRSPTW